MSKAFSPIDCLPELDGAAARFDSVAVAGPVNVLVIVPTLGIGGAETDLARILPRLDSNFKVTVFAFLARGPLAQILEAAGIEIIGPVVPRHVDWLLAFRRRLSLALSRWTHRLSLVLAALTPRAIRPVARRAWSVCGRVLARWRSKLSGYVGPLMRYLTGSRYTPFRAALIWPTYLLIALGLAPFIRVRRFDVIHTVLPNSYIIGSIANVFLNRRPLIMSRMSLNWYQTTSRLYRLVERRLLHSDVTAAVGNCDEILRQLQEEGIAPAKLRLIRNGIDIVEFSGRMIGRDAAREALGLSRTAVVFTVVANLHEYKGQADVLHAFKDVCVDIPECEIIFVGRDVEGNQAGLEAKCRELGIERRVHFLGERSDVPIILSASDVHVSGSHTEGLPNNIIEAMCARLPIVATAVGGTVDLLMDQKTGLLVPPFDPTKMARAMVCLAKNPGLRLQMGVAGRRHIASHFSVGASVTAFEKLYLEVAGPRQAPAPVRHARADKPTSGALSFRIDQLYRPLVREAAQEIKRSLIGATRLLDATSRPVRRFIAAVGGVASDALVARAMQGSWIRNLLTLRRDRLRTKFSFSYEFYDLATARPSSYRAEPRRILMIVPSFARGGAERMLIASAAGLVQRGYQVRILALEPAPQQPDYLEEVERRGLEYRIWAGRSMPFWAWLRRFNVRQLRPYAPNFDTWHYDWAAEIAVQIEDYRPTVVHAWLNLSILIAGPVCHLMGVPRFIGGQHDILDGVKRTWADPHVDAYRMVAGLPNATLTNVCSAGAREYERWLNVPEHTVKVLPNMFWPDSVRIPLPEEALDYRRRLGIPAGAGVVTTVTRMIDAKDPLLSVETAAEVVRVRPDTWFVLAGYGELADAVADRVRQLGLGDRVILPGGVADVGLIYAISDVFLLTSRAEASPIVLLEAQAAGRPSVTSDVGGIREVVLDGVTARVIASRSAHEFAEAVLDIFNDRQWGSRAEVIGPIFVAERFGPERVLDSTLELYGLPVRP